MSAVDRSRWAQLLITASPRLASDGFEIVERASDQYNYIPYVVGDTTKTWWPNEIDYWPPRATRDNRVQSLEEALASLGYEQCGDSNVESATRRSPYTVSRADLNMQRCRCLMDAGAVKWGMAGNNRTFQSRVAIWRSVRRRKDIDTQSRRSA